MVLKCKMCGGSLNISEGSGVAVCEYCGTKQTTTKSADDVLNNLYNRANNLRLKNEFDKAQSIYEKIVEMDDSEAEAHWGIILCKYGIEYVDDPKTGKKIPTCHRTSFESIKDDIDYQAAIDYADASQQALYEEEAREIDRLQKDILNIAKNEKPFDVFICYKETDEDGKRTIDSVIANDIYHQLTQEGFKVFYAAITLEDKLGQEYEPYIFAALNSAKVMLAIGTKPEHFNAVWVKNEWSRFLSLMKKDRTKLLIPCYRDMDAYDLPDEFAHLQAQDMSKIGFINDVVRGIKKIVVKEENKEEIFKPNKQNYAQAATNASSLLKRAYIFLEDNDYDNADNYFDRVLDQEPENGEAYLGKLLVEKRLPSIDALVDYYKELYSEDIVKETDIRNRYLGHIDEVVSNCTIENYLDSAKIKAFYNLFDGSYMSSLPNRINQRERISEEFKKNRLLSRAFEYASETTKKKLNEIFDTYEYRIEKAKQQDEDITREIIEKYNSFLQRTDQIIKEEYEKALNKQDEEYQSCVSEYNQLKSSHQAETLINRFARLGKYKDSNSYIDLCKKKLDEFNENEKQKWANYEKKVTKTVRFLITAIVAVTLILVVLQNVILPIRNYNKALSLYEKKDYVPAYYLFEKLGDYKDSVAYKEKILPAYLKETINSINVGETFIFGSYEQNGITSDGKEAIEWRVLAKEGNNVLVISEYGLNCKKFNERTNDTKWEECTLRTWLNSSFYSAAFNLTEREYIKTSIVTADPNPDYDTNQGGDTTDKIFVLSIDEANNYFESAVDRRCVVTKYAISQGALVVDKKYCWWWLRTGGKNNEYTTRVYHNGNILSSGNYATNDNVAVRPAMWITAQP